MGPKPDSTPPIIGILAGAARGDISLDPELAKKAEAAEFFQGSADDADRAAGNTGHDPDYITADVLENFRSMPHSDILAGIESMTPGILHQHAQAWKEMADATMFNGMGLNAKVHKSIAAGWDGRSADAVTTATTHFTNAISEMHNVGQSVMARIETAAYGADVVKAQVPPLPPPKPVPAVPGAESPRDAIDAVTTCSVEEQTARWAMVNHYVPSYQNAGQQVPMFLPPDIPDDDGVEPPSTVPGRDSGDNADKAAGHKSPDSGNGTGPGDQQPGIYQWANSPSPRQVSTIPTSSSGDSSPVPATTTPAGLDTAVTTPAGISGPEPGISSVGSPTVPDLSAPGSTGIPPAHGESGRSIPGIPVAGVPLGTPAKPSRPEHAAAGMSGMPGMGAPGPKGKSDDKERKGNPDLLAHERNKIDLIGEPQLATPPIFGADARKADTRKPPPEKHRESDW
ncbi:hypothetical protein NONO_c57480 [Nocardia nova SH22a]|uniref:PPE family protein n=1 Tax=Nocardia nova SH22a TaxID=1415166 RepID=W5TTK4_9NOCA|nr:hypothetical protein [Nocardia nova]AHH20526.1 hypothetical protein NONO_c57480 [Nocardia nova SH22a]